MRYWMDTEFVDDGKTIDLISIGIVCEDGREYYAQSSEFKISKVSSWVRENVFRHLGFCRYGLIGEAYTYALAPYDLRRHRPGCITTNERPPHSICPWRTREQIKHEIRIFFNPSDGIELWGYYSAHDHVVFCQLFGTMMDLPKGYPMYTRDLQQWCDQLPKYSRLGQLGNPQLLSNPQLPERGKGEHNALEDARWNKLAYEYLLNLERA